MIALILGYMAFLNEPLSFIRTQGAAYYAATGGTPDAEAEYFTNNNLAPALDWMFWSQMIGVLLIALVAFYRRGDKDTYDAHHHKAVSTGMFAMAVCSMVAFHKFDTIDSDDYSNMFPDDTKHYMKDNARALITASWAWAYLSVAVILTAIYTVMAWRHNVPEAAAGYTQNMLF